ncbi:hypothetical protein [Comamonas testosteroni]|uniref:hypothetical protein n=1 Tax=Comamonas testosteroni TaxID=285 RepID=UPI0012D7987C|nr:hypothetical protein [Comamonas testosteroni]
MRIALFKDSRASFLKECSNAGIDFEELMPMPGSIMASATFVTVAQAAAVAGSIAAVLVAWIKARSSRKVILTLQDKKIVHLEGYSVEEVKALLSTTEVVAVIDTKSIDSGPSQSFQSPVSGGV